FQALQTLDVAGPLHLHDTNTVTRDNRALLGHAKHPDFFKNAGGIELAGKAGRGPQAENMPLATASGHRIERWLDVPGGAPLVTLAASQVAPSIAGRQIHMCGRAWFEHRRHQPSRAE